MSTAKAPAAPSDRICEKTLPGQIFTFISTYLFVLIYCLLPQRRNFLTLDMQQLKRHNVNNGLCIVARKGKSPLVLTVMIS